MDEAAAGGVQSAKNKNLYRFFPPLHFMPRPLSLGQALELGQGEERKQNKSLPDSSSNSTHSHSTQRERQTTRGQTFFSVLYFMFDLFACTFFFNPKMFFFPLQSKLEQKGKDQHWRVKQKSPKNHEMFLKWVTMSAAVECKRGIGLMGAGRMICCWLFFVVLGVNNVLN